MGKRSLQFLDRNKFVLNTLKYFFKSKSSFVYYCPLNMTEAFFVDVSIDQQRTIHEDPAVAAFICYTFHLLVV